MRVRAATDFDMFGDLDHGKWSQQWKGRYHDMGGWPNTLVWDNEFSTDWQRGGFWTLLPHVAPGTDRQTHVFTHILFLEYQPLQSTVINKSEASTQCSRTTTTNTHI